VLPIRFRPAQAPRFPVENDHVPAQFARHAMAYCLPGDNPLPARMLSELWMRGDYDEYGAKHQRVLGAFQALALLDLLSDPALGCVTAMGRRQKELKRLPPKAEPRGWYTNVVIAILYLGVLYGLIFAWKWLPDALFGW
jgi:hypothetical protein